MDIAEILDQLQTRLGGLGLRFLDFLPNLIVALVVLLIGWLLAWLASVLIRRVGTALVARIATLDFMGRGFDHTFGATIPRVMSSISYWVLLLVFAAVGVEQLEVNVITDLFARLTQYLPDVVLATLIVFVGLVLGSAARTSVDSAAETANLGNAAALGRVSQVGVVTAAALVAADQIGVESTVLMVVFAITVGTSFGGVALAFGIGSGPTVSNIIASRDLRKTYRAGQLVRLGTTTGRILEIGGTFVVMDTEDGIVHIPANRFTNEVSVALRES